MLKESLSHYKVLGEISRGGMGIVYSALDVKLNREVALKVLPPELVSHPERKIRFVREAQAAAALKHPNIAVVYEIDDADDVTFIAMELIEGENLGDVIARGPLPMASSLSLAVEVADGLRLAHDKGIIHRDLKPGNIMMTPDGHAKIIDFGLAKLVERMDVVDSELDTVVRDRTASDVIMGTVAYMSPEQAKGERVDHRSDIFSLGIVLYEMLTGKHPFQAPSAPEILAAIIREPTPQLDVSTGDAAVRDLQHTLNRCLAKSRDERYDTAEELLRDLRFLKHESEDEILVRPSRPTVSRSSKTWRWAAVLVGAVALGALALILLPSSDEALRLTNPVQVTSAIGVEDFPSWSPDGRTIAYAASQTGNLHGGDWDIWVTQIAGGQPLNRTSDHSGADHSPSWSPDGRQVAFRSDRDDGGIFVMSPLSGAPRKLVPHFQLPGMRSVPAWSPDGGKLAYIIYDEGEAREHLEILSIRTGESRVIKLPGRYPCRCEISWSPDTDFLAYIDAQNSDSQVSQLWVFRLSDESAHQYTDGRTMIRSPHWSPDGRYLYYVSNGGGAMDLWQRRVGTDGAPDGAPRPVSSGIGMRRASLSPDGAKLAYSQGRRVANLWRIPILTDRPATWGDAQQLTFDQALIEYVDLSPDRNNLVVSSDRSGNPDLWIVPLDGDGAGDMIQLTRDLTPDWLASWSPDGETIAFYSHRSGNRHLWVVPADGGTARQLTRGDREDFYPAWSPDGGELVFFSVRNGVANLWAISVADGQERQLTDHSALDYNPKWSPDGERIVFSSYRDGANYLWLMDGSDDEPKRATEGPGHYPVWSPDAERIYFTGSFERAGNLWEVAVDGSFERPLTDFTARRGSLGVDALATDGEHLYFA